MLIGSNQTDVFWPNSTTALNDKQRSVAQSMPGLPSGVMDALADLPSGEVCGRCFAFDAEQSLCKERCFTVSPKDPGCHLFVPIES